MAHRRLRYYQRECEGKLITEHLLQALVARLSFVPYCLGWGASIAAAGNAGLVQFLGIKGNVVQEFRFDVREGVKEFMSASTSQSGQTIVFGNYNRFVLFSYNMQRNKWEQVKSPEIPNIYSISALRWKADGSRLASGSVTGAVDLFDACLRRYSNL